MAEKRPFFSVVIPTLNEEKYLPKLLKDLQAQLDRDFEVIVVDGKSEDKTVEKAEKFSGVKILASQKRNVSYQRNLGAKEAKGKWLVFLDADVRIDPNYLSEIHNYILKNGKCGFLTTWLKTDSKKVGNRGVVNVANLAIEAARNTDKPLVGGYNMIINRRMFVKYGMFNENWVPGVSEDFELCQRLADNNLTLGLVRSTRLTMSLRRFKREGTLGTLGKNSVSILRTLTEGPLSRAMFDYPMGGRVKVRSKANGFERVWKSLTAEL